MTTDYSVWLCDDRGEQLFLFGANYDILNYSVGVNGVGRLHTFEATMGEYARLEELRSLVDVDHQLQIWRKAQGGQWRPFVAFIRYWRWRLDRDGFVSLVIGDSGNQNDILRRRVVAYKAGTSQATASTIEADDAMKDIFNENFIGGATDTDRDISGLSVSVEGDETAGPTIDKGFSYERVSELLADINEQTRYEGTEVFYGIVITDYDYASGKISMEFQTFTGEPGVDRTHDTEHPVIFGPDFGNVEEMELIHDYRHEENAIYVAGQGVEACRTVVPVEDTDRQAASVWNRVEGFVNAIDVENTSLLVDVGYNPILTDRGNQRLNETRPITGVQGRIRSTEYVLYGRDWFEGDRVTVNAMGVQFDAIVRLVNVHSTGGEVEDVIGYVEAEL